MAHQWPTLTWSNLKYPWELEACWAGKGGWESSGGMSTPGVTRIPRQAPPALFSSFAHRGAQGAGFHCPQSSRHSGSSVARSQEAGGRQRHWSSIFATERLEKFNTAFHVLIVVQLRIRSSSYSLRLNVSCRRSLHLPTLQCLWWKTVRLLNWKDRNMCVPQRAVAF